MKGIKNFFISNFLLIYVIYFFTLFLDSTALEVDYMFLDKAAKIIRYFTYFLFLIRLIFLLPEYKKLILRTKWKDKSNYTKILYITTIVMIIGLIISAIVTTNRRNLFIIFVLICSLKTDYKKIFKTTMYMQLILTTILVTLCVLGVTQDYIVPRGNMQRHSLGFLYTTMIMEMYMFSLILSIYEKGSQISYKEICILQFINVVLFSLTNTRTVFVIVEIILLSLVIVKILKKHNKDCIVQKAKKIYSGAFSHNAWLLPIISFIITMCYKYGGIFYKINTILSNRLKQTYECFKQYGVTLFGTEITYKGYGLRGKLLYGEYESNFVDNGYMQLMLSEGLIFIICFTLILSLLLILLYKQKKYREIILCSIFLFCDLMNPRLVNLIYCPILFMIIPTFIEFGNKTKEKMK